MIPFHTDSLSQQNTQYLKDFQNNTYPKPHKSPRNQPPVNLSLYSPTPSKILERLVLNKINEHISLDNSHHGSCLLHSHTTHKHDVTNTEGLNARKPSPRAILTASDRIPLQRSTRITIISQTQQPT